MIYVNFGISLWVLFKLEQSFTSSIFGGVNVNFIPNQQQKKRCLEYELTMFRYILEQGTPLHSHQKNQLPPNVKTSTILISVVEGTFILTKFAIKQFEKQNSHRHGYFASTSILLFTTHVLIFELLIVISSDGYPTGTHHISISR